MTASDGDDRPGAPSSHGHSLEAQAVGKLERAGGAALVAQLAAMFLDDAPNRFAALRDSGSDSERLRLAHGFKTNCRILGAEGMAEHCQTLVEMAETGAAAEERGMQNGEAGLTDLEAFARVVDSLEAAFRDVEAEVVQLKEAAGRGDTQS